MADKKFLSAVFAAFVVMCSGSCFSEEDVKLPPGVKLPPQPTEWMAPPVSFIPPPASAPWAEAWTKARSLPGDLAAHCAFAFDDHVFVVGGVGGRDQLGKRDVWASKVDARGRLGRWRKTEPYPKPVCFMALATWEDRVYVIGGSSRGGMTNIYREVYSAQMKKGGRIGGWRKERSMPVELMYHSAAVCKGYIYILGGFDGQVYRDRTLYAKINADGTFSEWKETSARYRHPVGKNALVTVGDGIVSLSGMWSDPQGEHVSSIVKRGTPSADGDIKEWVDEGSLKMAARTLRFGLAEHVAATDGRFIYIVGGRDPDSPGLGTTQASWIDPKGALTTWQWGPELPLFGAKGSPTSARVYRTAAVIVGKYFFVLGGFLYVRETTNFVWTQKLKDYVEPDWVKKLGK